MYRTTYLPEEKRTAEDEMMLRASTIFHRFGVRLNTSDIENIALSGSKLQAQRIFRHIATVQQGIVMLDEDYLACSGACVAAYNCYSILMGFANSVGDAVAQWDFDRRRTPMSSWPIDINGRPMGSLEVYSRSQPEFKAQVRRVANSRLNSKSQIGTLYTLSAYDRANGAALFF